MHPHLFTRLGKDATLVKFAVHDKDATLVKFAVRDLDEQAIHSVKEQLTDVAGGSGPIEIHLDFDEVQSMGSTALAMLVSINRKVARNDGHVTVFNVADHLVELFQLTRLDTILDIRPRRVNDLNATRASA
jgi:anti-anti-sigma factor